MLTRVTTDFVSDLLNAIALDSNTPKAGPCIYIGFRVQGLGPFRGCSTTRSDRGKVTFAQRTHPDPPQGLCGQGFRVGVWGPFFEVWGCGLGFRASVASG